MREHNYDRVKTKHSSHQLHEPFQNVLNIDQFEFSTPEFW